MRAAKREQRAPELEHGKADNKNNELQHDARQTPRTPANDHLPHNVIMLAREHQQAFNAPEQARETADREQHAALKAEQRAEREAFFKDGAKQFKALRHAVYDEVRKDYAPEWRQLYQDTKVAEQSAEAWSKSSVTRALYFARDGQWERAGAAFADRDSVRDAVSAQLQDRKSDLTDRQTDDLRERQREACDALREQRDAQYQELLQRQREERGALTAGVTLRGLGLGPDGANDKGGQAALEQLANENRIFVIDQSPETGQGGAAARAEPTGDQQRRDDLAPAATLPEQAATPTSSANTAIAGRADAESQPVVGPTIEAPEVTRQVADLAAGAIGGAASYLADQLGELFAPTPPEVREAQAKAEAKRDAENPPASEKTGPYDKIIGDAVRALRDERTQQQDDAYWKERDRGKGWERDQ